MIDNVYHAPGFTGPREMRGLSAGGVGQSGRVAGDQTN